MTYSKGWLGEMFAIAYDTADGRVPVNPPAAVTDVPPGGARTVVQYVWSIESGKQRSKKSRRKSKKNRRKK